MPWWKKYLAVCIFKHKRRKVCRANNYRCPDCPYGRFVFGDNFKVALDCTFPNFIESDNSIRRI